MARAGKELGKDERVVANWPDTKSSPFDSIFALESGCDNCGDIHQGTCFILNELNNDEKKSCQDYYLFVTAGHNIFCGTCLSYSWVRIYENLEEETYLLDTDESEGKISRYNKNGWLKVPDSFENKERKELTDWGQNYGIIAAKKSKCERPVKPWNGSLMLAVMPSCTGETLKVHLSGFPQDVVHGGVQQIARPYQYWVKEAREAHQSTGKNLLEHFVDTSSGQSGSPLFVLPENTTETQSAHPAYVVGIHVGCIKGKDSSNLAVRLKEKSGDNTKPMKELEYWAENPQILDNIVPIRKKVPLRKKVPIQEKCEFGVT